MDEDIKRKDTREFKSLTDILQKDKRYYYSDELIESRVLSSDNIERLKKHRRCEFCQLCLDCIIYHDRHKINLCEFVDNYLEGDK